MCEAPETFFDNFPKNPTDEVVLNIESLTQFASNIVAFCELQGKALYLIKNDVGGNIKKITNSCGKYKASTVEEMLVKEKEAKVNKNDNSGSIGLLWLTRAIELVIEVMTELPASSDRNMREIGRAAYAKTLMKHHNVIMKNLFYAGLALFPDKHSFLLRLAYNKPNMDTQVLDAMKEFVTQYRNVMEPVQQLLVKYGIEDSPITEPENSSAS
ncbi:glycolipid transfer protein [Echinococcus multilocularis]|uniref:Glycolipid transfer protein n=1 Tax=Echinococcus multilocularis TaxID=6211 RepID=A0A068YE97_ECHMU|nr:glycolipid transfer protein [Echinococcus multilocularis]